MQKLIWFCIAIYFRVVQFGFWLFNQVLATRRTVPKATESLLLQSATTLARKIREQSISSEAVVKAYIERIEATNDITNAVVVKNFEQALDEARKVDARIDAGVGPTVDEAPFLGVPFTLKDCIFVNGLVCTAGIPCREGVKAEYDADVVKHMKNAGTIVLAVTNVSEVCMWWESNNGIYGRTRNAYDSRRIVGGSSGGEGCLISCAGSVFGIGSDIGGSIRMPAYFNGIFGHKPSRMVVSDVGTHPPCYGYQVHMHTAGPMCRYAEDLSPMLKVLCGPNAADLNLDVKPDLKQLRVFYMEDLHSYPVAPLDIELRGALKRAVKYLERKFNIAAVRVDLPSVHQTILMWLNDMEDPECSPFNAQMVDNQSAPVNQYSELGKILIGRSKHTIPALVLATYEHVFTKFFPQSEETKKLLVAKRKKLERIFAELLGDNGVFLFPPHATLPPYHNQPLLMPFNFAYTALFNSLTLPVTSVPMGLSESQRIPLGIQVSASMNRDALTIAVAQELERAFGGWVNGA